MSGSYEVSLSALFADIVIFVVLFLWSYLIFHFGIFQLRKRGFLEKFIMLFWKSRLARKLQTLKFVRLPLLYARNTRVAVPLIFLLLFVFGVSLLSDLWYHDHFGIDKPFSPVHLPFYPLTPLLIILLVGQTLQKYRSWRNKWYLFNLWLGEWFLVVGFVVNIFWHSLGFVETYAAPPHALFVTGGVFIIISMRHIYLNFIRKEIPNFRQNWKWDEKLTLSLYYLSLSLLVLVVVGWALHAEDIGGSGFVDLSEEFATKHPHPDIRPLMEQIDLIRHSTPLVIPSAFVAFTSIFATAILKRRIFPVALTLIFLLDFLILSAFHFPFKYLPIVMLPVVILDILSSLFRRIIFSNYFPVIVACFTSLLFYALYYPYSNLVDGIEWPSYIIIQVIPFTFLISVIFSWVASKLKS